MSNRVVKSGQVAVLYSPSFGAGWSTWNRDHCPDMVFDPWIVDLLLNSQSQPEDIDQQIQAHCALKYPGAYLGGLQGLKVGWIPQGSLFKIEEYDGSESIELRDGQDWMQA